MAPRTTGFALLAALVAAGGGVARAAGDGVTGRAGEVAALEAARAPLVERHATLEARSSAEAAEIERLKAEPPGIARDLRLGQQLAAAKQRADELSVIATRLRVHDARLAEARRALVEACGRALADPALSPARREQLTRLREAAERTLAAASGKGDVKVAPASAIDPLAGPAELLERADRLRDDEDKLRREESRLARQIDALEEQRRLSEHAAEMEDDLFVESGVARHVQRPAPQMSSNPTIGSSLAGGVVRSDIAPSPVPPSDSPSLSLRGVLDPSTLDQLRRARTGQDIEEKLHALRRARGDLGARAAELERREAELRRRAALLHRSK